MAGERVLLDGEDVTDRVRSSDVTAVMRDAADNPPVRSRLVELQRAFARGKNIVTEGCDQGTVAFPEAECKISSRPAPRSGPAAAGRPTIAGRAGHARTGVEHPAAPRPRGRRPAHCPATPAPDGLGLDRRHDLG